MSPVTLLIYSTNMLRIDGPYVNLRAGGWLVAYREVTRFSINQWRGGMTARSTPHLLSQSLCRRGEGCLRISLLQYGLLSHLDLSAAEPDPGRHVRGQVAYFGGDDSAAGIQPAGSDPPIGISST